MCVCVCGCVFSGCRTPVVVNDRKLGRFRADRCDRMLYVPLASGREGCVLAGEKPSSGPAWLIQRSTCHASFSVTSWPRTTDLLRTGLFRKNTKKKKQGHRTLWDTSRCTSFCNVIISGRLSLSDAYDPHLHRWRLRLVEKQEKKLWRLARDKLHYAMKPLNMYWVKHTPWWEYSKWAMHSLEFSPGAAEKDNQTATTINV